MRTIGGEEVPSMEGWNLSSIIFSFVSNFALPSHLALIILLLFDLRTFIIRPHPKFQTLSHSFDIEKSITCNPRLLPLPSRKTDGRPAAISSIVDVRSLNDRGALISLCLHETARYCHHQQPWSGGPTTKSHQTRLHRRAPNEPSLTFNYLA